MISQWLHDCCGPGGWSLAFVLVPVILITVGIVLLAWYFTRMLQGRKRMF